MLKTQLISLLLIRSGIPSVLSPIAAEGTGLRNKNDCLIAKTNKEWTSSILDLMNNKSLWEKISSKSINFSKDMVLLFYKHFYVFINFSWSRLSNNWYG